MSKSLITFPINQNIFYGGKIQSYDEKNYSKGILRIKHTNNNNITFDYKYTKNNKNISEEDLKRIKELKIPPMWDYVWISNNPKTEIQVIGHDKRNKKQYIYSKEHKEKATKNKFGNLQKLINLIPKLNELIIKHDKLNYFNKHKILTTIIKIILLTGMRAGKEFHVNRNDSYGVTSLRKKHIILKNGKVYFEFKGKGNIMHKHVINDNDIYNHLDNLLKFMPNEDKIFLYKDKDKVKKITEHLLNNYLHKYLDKNIVIKDLRTYLVNYIFVKNLLNKPKNNLKSNIKNAILETANFIQHTPTISKNSYINPEIIDKYLKDVNFFIVNKKNNPLDVLKTIINN